MIKRILAILLVLSLTRTVTAQPALGAQAGSTRPACSSPRTAPASS